MKRTRVVITFSIVVLSSVMLVNHTVVGLVAQSPSRRVTIVTTKGDTVEGALRTISDKDVTLEVAGQPLAIPIDNVRYISFAGKIEGAGPAVVPALSTARQNALAALHAVESAVAGGANAAEFKRYHLDAKIKVDSLPATPENAPLRHVSQIYVDASTLMTASLTRTLSADEVRYFKAQYGSLGSKPLNDLPNDGIDSIRQTSLVVQLGANSARFAGMGLLQFASSELQKVTTAPVTTSAPATPAPARAAAAVGVATPTLPPGVTHPANWNIMSASEQEEWTRNLPTATPGDSTVIPPVRGMALVTYTKPVTKKIGSNVVTNVTVRNVGHAPIAHLAITETWYDKEKKTVTGGQGSIEMLQPGESSTITITTAYNPRMFSNNYNFTHANGGVTLTQIQ